MEVLMLEESENSMKEYKYRQYKVNIPVNYTNLIEILDSYSTHMRNKVILETLQDGLVLNAASVHKRLEGNVEDYEQEAVDKISHENKMQAMEQQYNNDKILKMIEALTEKIETLEHRETAGGNESREKTADKKEKGKASKDTLSETEQPVTDAENTEPEPVPDVPTEVLDFLQTLN